MALKKKTVKKKTATKKKKKAKKRKVCEECEFFKYYRAIDFDTDFYHASGIAKGTIAFIMAPLDFENLHRQNWKHILCGHLHQYNILFLPYVRCYENALTASSYVKHQRHCKESFIKDYIKDYDVDLMVVFPDSKMLIEVDDKKVIKFPGNWEHLEWLTQDEAAKEEKEQKKLI